MLKQTAPGSSNAHLVKAPAFLPAANNFFYNVLFYYLMIWLKSNFIF